MQIHIIWKLVATQQNNVLNIVNIVLRISQVNNKYYTTTSNDIIGMPSLFITLELIKHNLHYSTAISYFVISNFE